MTRRQKLVIATQPFIGVVMIPVFRLLAEVFAGNWRIGWFLGLFIYWLIWGAAFPLLILGKKRILAMIRPQKPDLKTLGLVAIPVLMVSLNRLVPVMQYATSSALVLGLEILTAFGNGFFEEVLWRGVSMQVFPDDTFFRVIWSSVWFALWHYAPGSIAPGGSVIFLMIGAALFGLLLSYLAKRTNTLWWCIVAHTLSGLIVVA